MRTSRARRTASQLLAVSGRGAASAADLFSRLARRASVPLPHDQAEQETAAPLSAPAAPPTAAAPPKRTPTGPGHAPGHRHLGPPPDVPEPREARDLRPQHDQPWVPTGGLTDKQRRSERRG